MQRNLTAWGIYRMPSIAVIIPTYNGGDRLLACLDAVYRQARRADEIIVIDDASQDGSGDVAGSRFPDANIVRLTRNQGFCHAANVGLRAARSELLCLLNDDTEVDDCWLSEVLRAAERAPTIGFFASKMLFFDRRDTINSAGLFVRPDGVARDIGFGEADGPAFAAPRQVLGASGGAAVFRRAVLDDVGLLDEDLFAYGEDVDLSLRAQLRGWSCQFVPSAIVYHRLGASFGRESSIKVYYSSRNMLTVVLKNFPSSLLLRYSVRIAIVNLYQIVYNASRGRGIVALRGKIDALRALPLTLAKRKSIQRSARVSAGHVAALFGVRY